MSGLETVAIGGGVLAVLATIGAALVLSLVRLALGPTLPDRVVALDVVANLAVGVIAGCAIAFDDAALLQPALVMALVAFVGTVAFARFLERDRS